MAWHGWQSNRTRGNKERGSHAAHPHYSQRRSSNINIDNPLQAPSPDSTALSLEPNSNCRTARPSRLPRLHLLLHPVRCCGRRIHLQAPGYMRTPSAVASTSLLQPAPSRCLTTALISSPLPSPHRPLHLALPPPSSVRLCSPTEAAASIVRFGGCPLPTRATALRNADPGQAQLALEPYW